MRMGMVEWRRKEEHELFCLPHQMFLDGLHCLDCPPGIARAADYRPGLRERIYPGFLILPGTQRRPIVEISAPVPFAIPARFFDRGAHSTRVRAILLRQFPFATPLAENRKSLPDIHQEPGQPDALAFSFVADTVHPVIPVASTDQWQPMNSMGAGLFYRPAAVLKQA